MYSEIQLIQPIFAGTNMVAKELREQISRHLNHVPQLTFNRLDQGFVAQVVWHVGRRACRRVDVCCVEQVLHTEVVRCGEVPNTVFSLYSELLLVFCASITLFILEWRISTVVLAITPLTLSLAARYSGKVQERERTFALEEVSRTK